MISRFKLWQQEHFLNYSVIGLMLPDIICHICYHVYLQKQKWQQLQTVLTAVMQQNWMHHVCCQTITF